MCVDTVWLYFLSFHPSTYLSILSTVLAFLCSISEFMLQLVSYPECNETWEGAIPFTGKEEFVQPHAIR